MTRLNLARNATAALLAPFVSLLGLPLLGLGAAGAAAPAAARPAPTALAAVTAAPAPTHLAGVQALGAMPPSATITGAVALRLRDPSALAAVIASASDPRSAGYRHYLTAAGFAREFGPAPATVAAVERVLGGGGLRVTGVSPDGLLVHFSGPASAVERVFHTGIERYRLAGGGLGYATTSAAEIPAAVAASVTAVAGLDDLVRPMSHLMRRPAGAARHRVGATPATPPRAFGGPVSCPGAESQVQFGAVTDTELAESYGAYGLYAGGDLGAGQTVDIFELEPFATSDIRAFDDCYFGADHTGEITTHAVDGGSGGGEGSGEATLDVEDVSALAPEAAIHVYEGPNTVIGSLDVYDAMVTAGDSNVISTSWGLCETALQAGAPGTQQIESTLFMEAAARGESIFAAAGDDGSDDCANQGPMPVAQYLSVDDPGSQPYVVGVGGTTFVQATQPPDEVVWNDGNSGGAGGGGMSETWQMPAWQLDSGVPGVTDNPYVSYRSGSGTYPYLGCSNDPSGTATDMRPAGSPSTLPSGTPCREDPDVAALADELTGITVYYSGWTAFGGTSSSAPLWAAMTADMNASRWCGNGASGLGFVNPVFYDVAGSPTTDAESFDDITLGNNDSVDVGTDLPLGAGNNTYQAGSGYDLASGLGTPRLTNAAGTPGLAELACDAATASTRPSVASVSPPYGSAGGGTALTITGAGFGTTPGTVQLGTSLVPTGDITSWGCTTGSTCTITLTTPPFAPPPGTDGPPGGTVAVLVHRAGATSAVSAPGPSAIFHYLAAASGPEPVVEYVGPAGGNDAGGTVVDVVGSGFEDGSVTSVTFGGVAGSGIRVLSDSELMVTTPSDAAATCAAGSGDVGTGACQTQVVVTTTAGTSPTSTILPAAEGAIPLAPNLVFVPPPGCDCEVVPAATEFDYSPAPTITSVAPSYGSALGGDIVTIDGSGFNLLTYDWTGFGDPTANASQDIGLVSITPDSLQVTGLGDAFSASGLGPEPTPASVSVQSLAGLAVNGAGSPFAYAGVPVVDSLSTSFGPTTGGESLTIGGAGLRDATSVQIVSQIPSPFGVQSSTVFVTSPPVNDTSLTITTPAGQPGPNDVEVCSATGCSSANPAVDTYSYGYPGQPLVSSAAPAKGPAQGGTTVTINGNLLSGLRAVYFGTQLAASWATGPSQTPQGSSTEVTAVAPPGAAGSTVDVTVLTDGSSSPSPVSPRATFTYVLSPPSAPLDVRAAGGAASAVVSWSPPAGDGGDTIASYLVTASAAGRAGPSVSVPASARSASFATLQPGVPWTFTVRAVSALGDGLAASTAPAVLAAGDNGYLVATANGAVLGFGSLSSAGGPGGERLPGAVVGMAATADGLGYFLALSDGTVRNFGDAGFYGSATLPPGAKVVGIAATSDAHGYWLVTASGAVYAFGDAHFRGGAPAGTSGVVGIAGDGDGFGYWLATAGGAVLHLGDAPGLGQLTGVPLHAPIVGITVNRVKGGYWLLGGDGGVFAFSAGYHGSMIGSHLNGAAVGLAATPDGAGYWIVAADGGLFAFGSARYEGNPIGKALSASVAVAGG